MALHHNNHPTHSVARNYMYFALSFLVRLATVKKKIVVSTLIVLAVILTILLLRSCHRSATHVPHRAYVIGRDNTWYPMKVQGKERLLQGFTNDLLTAISKLSIPPLQVHIAESGAKQLLLGLEDEDYDAIFYAFPTKALSEENLLFSDVILKTGPVLVVRNDSKIQSLQDLQKETLGLLMDSPLAYDIVRQSPYASAIEVIPYNTVYLAVEAIMKNQIDAILIDSLQASTMTQNTYPGMFKIVTTPLNDEGLRLVGWKKNPLSESFIEHFNTNFEILKKNGTYEALIKKWDLLDPDVMNKK